MYTFTNRALQCRNWQFARNKVSIYRNGGTAIYRHFGRFLWSA